MIIRSMTATFGKLEHETLTLEPGLNVIDAPNEWGKSTWCAFLMTMLYGLDTRERSTKTNLADKERYAPWSGSPMSGRIQLEWQGRAITIERRSKGRTPMGEFRAYETESGLPVAALTAANCGQQLLGVERSVFARSGFLRGAEMPVVMNEELRSRLNALVTTGDDSGTAEELGQRLKELKNRCRYNRGGLIPQAESRRDALAQRLREHEALERQICQIESQCQAMFRQPAASDSRELEAAIRDEEAARLRCQELERLCAALPDRETALNPPEPNRRGRILLLILGGMLLLAGIAVLALNQLWGLVPVTLGLGLWGLMLRSHKGVDPEITEQWARLDRAREALDLARQRRSLLETLRQSDGNQEQLRQLHVKLGQCQGRMAAIGDPERIRNELTQLERRIEELERKERALTLALEALEEAQSQLQRRFAPGIARRAQSLFGKLTDGRYDRLTLGQELAVLAGAEGEDTLRSPLWRSEGTTDQLYLALRLAVAEELTPAAPLVLDDALIRFDDHRLELAMRVLEETAERKQVIVFSCRQISVALQ